MLCADPSNDLPLPCLDALIAGTMALMTTWAEPAVDPAPERAARRRLLARKIVSNLFFLQHHPAASDPLRQVMLNLHRQWQPLAAEAETIRPPVRPPMPTLTRPPTRPGTPASTTAAAPQPTRVQPDTRLDAGSDARPRPGSAVRQRAAPAPATAIAAGGRTTLH